MAPASPRDKSPARWLLYGANGYTGTLIAEAAHAAGEAPVLAGRREAAVRPLAERLGFEARVFGLDDARALRDACADVDATLLAAGPFSATSAPVLAACLDTETHYLDVTGEIAVFEDCFRRSEDAARAGVVVLPGVGFDVVPSDCLARTLVDALPEATHLSLAFHSDGGPSRGTMMTVIEGLPLGGAVRRAGRIEKVPPAWRVREIPFRDRPRLAMTIPWGDVSTAWHSTGVDDIEVYVAASPRTVRATRLSRPFLGLTRLDVVQRFLKSRVDARPAPRAGTGAQLWGRAEAGARAVEGTLTTPPGYALTAATALECTRRVATGDVEPGTWTPSRAFGARFIERFGGCDLRVGEVNAR